MKYLKIFFINSLLICIFFSCRDADDSISPTDNGFINFVIADSITTQSAEEMQAYLNSITLLYTINFNEKAKAVTIYKVIYKTKTADLKNDIDASGLLIVPETKESLPLLSYQHGTISSDADAPSSFNPNFSLNSLERQFLAMVSSLGFILLAPDYLGYNASKNYPHPYEHANSLGKTSYDMISAIKEYTTATSIKTSDKLFLTGYSEGGYATMALHKHIEENSSWTVTHSAPASGAYNKTKFANEILYKNQSLPFMGSYLWVLDVYNKLYNINRPWNEIVTSSNTSVLENAVINNALDVSQINTNPQNLFLASFREGILNQTDSDFVQAIKDNDIYDWAPKAPITLYHGNNDDYVYPSNSETAYQAIRAKGGTIDLISLEGNHNTAITPYFTNVINLFLTLK